MSVFNNSLVDNYTIDELLNLRVLENRARSVSPEFLCRYGDDICNLYLYDLIAYILLNCNKSDGKLIDEEVIALFAFSECKMLSEEFVILSKDKYLKLMEILVSGRISCELYDMLRTLYIYNAAYMENDYFINVEDVNAAFLEERNKILIDAKKNIKI